MEIKPNLGRFPLRGKNVPFKCVSFNCILVVVTAVLLKALGAASVVVPRTNCYALDNSSRLLDFSGWIGYPFEYEGKEADLVVRFCKDVETRSQTGYVDFGRFDQSNYFIAGSGHVDFIQGYYYGDLMNCEQSYDKMGRTAQVNMICGNCLNEECRGGLGCICNVTYKSPCSEVNISIPIKGYEPIQFVLTKMCESKQNQGGDSMKGWALFGVFSCILIVSSVLFCCGGYVYKARVEGLRGLDALPGMSILSACMETVNGTGQGYSRPEDLNSAVASEASWGRPPVSPQGTWRLRERKYGSV
ncbi:uncharacterized protein LOC110822474 [Carica papaya]|uniref:uncharacterized protein LOC110822474 n=1 Tax=Carica papaya TaxID=3649 RepID=UPI000B8C778F|nr:uncharacterized protein LOC110822474 [Carica papaya]